MVHEAINGRERHGLIREDFSPFAEGLIGGDEYRSPLVTGTHQFEQNARLRLIFGDISEIVEDQQMIFVEFGDGRFEHEIAARDLEFLHEVAGSREQHAPALFDQGQAERRRQVGLPPPGGPKHKRLAPISSQASPAASA